MTKKHDRLYKRLQGHEREIMRQALRAPSAQPSGKKAEVTKVAVGDVSDSWLRGRDGTLHPAFDAGSRKRR
jgi:hypothetical protein